MTERLVWNLFQRLPLPVALLARPGSWAHWSGATPGSATIFEPAGMLATIHARVRLRVSSRASTRSLWTV